MLDSASKGRRFRAVKVRGERRGSGLERGRRECRVQGRSVGASEGMQVQGKGQAKVGTLE